MFRPTGIKAHNYIWSSQYFYINIYNQRDIIMLMQHVSIYIIWYNLEFQFQSKVPHNILEAIENCSSALYNETYTIRHSY